VHGGSDQSVDDAYSSSAHDPTFLFVGNPCCPLLDFVIDFWIMITFYTFLTSPFCISNIWIRLLIFHNTYSFCFLVILRLIVRFISYIKLLKIHLYVLLYFPLKHIQRYESFLHKEIEKSWPLQDLLRARA
jgi:hypothetical protein